MASIDQQHTLDQLLSLRGALNSVDSTIYTIDRSYRITMVNAGWHTFASANGAQALAGPQAIGMNLLDGMRGQPREETQRACEAIFRGELARYERDYDCSSPTERRIFTLVISPLRDDNGAIVGAAFINHNITRRKLLEEQLEGSNAEIRAMLDELRYQNELLTTERDRAQALGNVLNSINASTSVPSAVNAVLGVATTLVDVDGAAVYLLTPGEQHFTPAGTRSLDIHRSDQRAFTLATSLVGHVARNGAAEYVENASILPSLVLPLLDDGTTPQSAYSLPINTFQGTIGALEVYTKQRKHFDDQERNVLWTLAASTGVAISNAHFLEEQVRARTNAERLAQVASEQAAQLLATFSSLSDGVWICDKNGVLVSVNDAGLTMFGLRRADVIGVELLQLPQFYDVKRGERRRLGLRVALMGEHLHSECDIVLPNSNQRLTIEVRAAPVRDGGEIIGAVSVVRDITEAQAMARLKDDFLAIAAHELKTPITALKGYTQLVLKRTRDLPNLDNVRRALHTIDEQADRISNLVHKLLDVTHIQTGNLELQYTRLDLHNLIARTVERMQVAVPAQRFELLSHAPIIVDVDQQRIEQVLGNLLDNAVKYSGTDAPIVVETSADDTFASVTVRDQGVGIPVEKLPHIFDQWYQAHYSTHGDYGGMGLGLYISKEIVDQHGGRMWADSSPDGGTTIGFTIPLPSA
jgi:PAS domain S-box-containing protein